MESRETYLRRTYGISEDEYFAQLEYQGGRCAICKQLPRIVNGEPELLCQDHCHASGENRELLCQRCNRLLGQAKDDPRILEAAAAYVRKFTSSAIQS
jgi:hypothetical protein